MNVSFSKIALLHKSTSAGVRNTPTQQGPVFLRALAPIETVVTELTESADQTYTHVTYDRETTSYKKLVNRSGSYLIFLQVHQTCQRAQKG